MKEVTILTTSTNHTIIKFPNQPGYIKIKNEPENYRIQLIDDDNKLALSFCEPKSTLTRVNT